MVYDKIYIKQKKYIKYINAYSKLVTNKKKVKKIIWGFVYLLHYDIITKRSTISISFFSTH